MPDIMIVADVVERMRTDLSKVRAEFESANSYSESAAEATGHIRLGTKVYDFSHNWDQRRKELVAQIQNIEANLDMIDTQFGELDVTLSQSLDGN